MSAIARVSAGELQGREKGGVYLFAGVPYAAPPTEARRFCRPVPHEGWQGIRDARKFSPAAPQVSSGGLTDPAPVRWDEDCLTLNIQTPGLDDKARPVLLWIHGGGYRTGQGAIPWYNGKSFCSNGDIVVVSINYRLGALGFTDLRRFGAEFEASGAIGTEDQLAALDWVREHIAVFGGDPDRITIAGESAGGFSVATVLSAPQAQGKIVGAIPQSGAAHSTLSRDQGAQVTDAFLRHLGVDDIVGLQAASAQQILDAQVATIAELEKPIDKSQPFINALGVGKSAFYPVHDTPSIPQPPIDAIRAGAGSDVRVLAGSNADETTLWGYGKVDENKLNAAATAYNAQSALAAHREAMPDASPEQLLIALTTDHMFRIPAIRLVEARAETAISWMYLFNWQSRAFNGRLGATHALEIPFAFNNLRQPGVDGFLGPGELPQGVADAMHEAWTRFIREGDPGWAPYETSTRTTMLFDTESSLANDPHAAVRQAWDGVR